MTALRRCLAALLAPVVLAGCQTGAQTGTLTRATVPQAPILADAPHPTGTRAHGPFVAAANPLAVEAGMRVLRRGGSAVDAAVAIQAVLGGKFVYLECEDKDALLNFYGDNGFVIFGKRDLDRDERDRQSGQYLVQLLKYLGD